MPAPNRLAGLVNLVGRWMGRTPPLARDLLSYGVLVATFAATAGLPRVEFSLAVVPMAIAIVVLALVIGRAAALFGSLLLLISVRMKRHLNLGEPVPEGDVLLACAAGFALAAVLDRLRWHRENAARAYHWAELNARQQRDVGSAAPTPMPAPTAAENRPAFAPAACVRLGRDDSFAKAFSSEGGV